MTYQDDVGDTNSRMTDFGFRRVRESEKASMVGDVFDHVAPKYDLMNDLMSGGIHRLWKADLIRRINPRAGMAILDVGGGTGDIAFGCREKGADRIQVCDINREMLEVGRNRAIDRNITGGITWTCGDAEALPVESDTVDIYVTAFCMRNVTRLDKALQEARRVLKPGGHFMCLEFSQVALPLLSDVYDAYSFGVLPLIGQVVAGDRDAYQYLAESIRRFPPQRKFADMIKDAGLEQVSFDNVSGGIAAIHSAWRI